MLLILYYMLRCQHPQKGHQEISTDCSVEVQSFTQCNQKTSESIYFFVYKLQKLLTYLCRTSCSSLILTVFIYVFIFNRFGDRLRTAPLLSIVMLQSKISQ